MPADNYYLLTALPSLAEPPAEPPIKPVAMLDMMEHAPGPHRLAATIFLSDDLQLRQAVMASEVPAEKAEPVVLSAEQVRDEAPLPACLTGEDEGDDAEAAGQLAADRVWANYFRHAADVARGCAMLTEWVRYEVGLRNAVAVARAKALELDAVRYLVEPELGLDADEFDSVLSEWSAAGDPLAGLKVLDNARWAWIAEHAAHYSFRDDELAAYAARLVILHRWKRIGAAEQARHSDNDLREEKP